MVTDKEQMIDSTEADPNPVEVVFVNGVRVEINKDETYVGREIYRDIVKESNKYQRMANKDVKLEREM